MAKNITPRLDFSAGTPVEHTHDGLPAHAVGHSGTREAQNNLAWYKFDEYERLLVEIAAAIGDYEFSTLTAGSVLGAFGSDDNVRDAVDTMWVHLNNVAGSKFDKVGGTISGNVSIVKGTPSGGLSVSGIVTMDSFQNSWKPATYYRPGDLVSYDYRMYQCAYASGMASGAAFETERGYWDEFGITKGTEHLVYDPSHGFAVGDAIYYHSGYHKAIADDPSTLAMFIVTKVYNSDYFVAQSTGYFEHTATLGYIANTMYYLSETVPGALVDTAPRLVSQGVFAISDRAGFVMTASTPIIGVTLNSKQYEAADGQTDFILDTPISTKEFTFLSIDGVLQDENAYDLQNGGLRIHLAEGLEPGQSVYVRWLQNVQAGAGAYMKVYNFTASGTVGEYFDVAEDVESTSYVMATVNKVLQTEADFNLTGSRRFTFTSTLSAGAAVRFQIVHRLQRYYIPDGDVSRMKIQPDLRRRIQGMSRFLIKDGSPVSLADIWINSANTKVEGAQKTTAAGLSAVYSYFDHIALDLGNTPSSYGSVATVSSVINTTTNKGKDRIFYGRIDLPTLSGDMTAAQTAIYQYYSLGFKGIFLDNAGYVNGISRTVLNSAVGFARGYGLNVLVSADDPDELFSSSGHVLNASGIASLASGELVSYLWRPFVLHSSGDVDFDSFYAKAQKCLNYRTSMGIGLVGVSTLSIVSTSGTTPTVDTLRQSELRHMIAAETMALDAYGFENINTTNNVVLLSRRVPSTVAESFAAERANAQLFETNKITRYADGAVAQIYKSGTAVQVQCTPGIQTGVTAP